MENRKDMADKAKDAAQKAKGELDEAEEKMRAVLGDGREKIPGGMREGDQPEETLKGLGDG